MRDPAIACLNTIIAIAFSAIMLESFGLIPGIVLPYVIPISVLTLLVYFFASMANREEGP